MGRESWPPAGFDERAASYCEIRRGETITRGHELQRLEHVMVRDVMVCDFPSQRPSYPSLPKPDRLQFVELESEFDK